MWRWAFLPPQYRNQGDVYGSLWHSLIRWLASGSGLPPGARLALRADKIAFRTNEPVTATLLLPEEVAHREIPKVELAGNAPQASKSFTLVAAGDEPGTFRVLVRHACRRAAIAGGSPDRASIPQARRMRSPLTCASLPTSSSIAPLGPT